MEIGYKESIIEQFEQWCLVPPLQTWSLHNHSSGAHRNAPTQRCMLDNSPQWRGSYLGIYPLAGRCAVDAVK